MSRRSVTYLVRHGQTASNVAQRYAGRSAEQLTEAGRSEVTQLANKLTACDMGEIWTSEKYVELRRQIYNMELRDVCANCSVANMGRPDVKASFSHRAKVRRGNQLPTIS